jgi:protein-disulfide isomerase
MNKKIIIAISATLLIIAFALAAVMYKKSESSRLSQMARDNLSTFIRDYSPTLGPNNAKVFLVEFLDPECETCRQFYPFVKALLKKYDGKVQLIVRYAPFHPNSKFAIKILEAARLQGKYWETLETLFQMQDEWSGHHDPDPEKVWGYLPGLGLDVERIKKDMESPTIAANLEQDVQDGAELNVRQTPGFFINGQPLESFGDWQLIEAIEKALNE